MKKKPGLMIFLDFEKAFDTFSRKFLHITLKYFNFGESFIKWSEILYNKSQAYVTNNGHSTDFF